MELGVRGLFVFPGLLQNGAVYVCCVWVRLSASGERAALCQIHCQLRSAVAGKVLGEDLDAPRVAC